MDDPGMTARREPLLVDRAGGPVTNTEPEAHALLAVGLLFGTRPTDRALIGWYDDLVPAIELLAMRPIREVDSDGD
jgi:hypothetical protein